MLTTDHLRIISEVNDIIPLIMPCVPPPHALSVAGYRADFLTLAYTPLQRIVINEYVRA